MSIELVSLGKGVGFMKAGFLGFQGSGKTFTAMELAIFLRKFQNLEGPIAMFDTEAAANYLNKQVREATGKDLIGFQSRALADARAFIQECVEVGVSVAVIDSVTHLWRELCSSYQKAVNRTRLEFQDWGPIKAEWEKFSNLFLNAPLHVIICGRAGYEYEYQQVNSTDDKKQLVKTGIKMKSEGEFGYEPSILVEMELVQINEKSEFLPKPVHRATILKDRFNVMNGATADDPAGSFFLPFVQALTPGSHVEVQTNRTTDIAVTGNDAAWNRERKDRTIFCEEIAGVLTREFPGQSAAEKLARQEVVNMVFGTRSWTAVEALDSRKLLDGLKQIPDAITAYRESLKPEAKAETAVIK